MGVAGRPAADLTIRAPERVAEPPAAPTPSSPDPVAPPEATAGARPERPSPARPRHRRRRLRIPLGEATVVLLAAGLLYAFYASLAWLGFDLLEEGYFLTHARRVQQGGLPYRDFSTPYTPGVFYLYAWAMDALRADVVTLRLLTVAGRIVTFVALYAGARWLMPPAFAVLPGAVMVVMDTAPELWGIHPGWLTTAAATLAVIAVARYITAGGAGWLFAAGVLSGVAFLFKQNLAVYGLIASLWFVVVAEGRLPRWAALRLPPLPYRLTLALKVAIQVAALVLLPLTAAVIVRPYFSPLVGTLYVLPLAALSAAGALLILPRPGVRLEDGTDRWGFFLRPLLVLAGFAAVTLPWLSALVGALDGRLDLLGGFVGRIDPTGYYFGMKPFTGEHLALIGAALLPAAVVLGVARSGLWGRWGVAALLGGALLFCAAAATTARPAGDPAEEPWSLLGAVQRLTLVAGTAWQDYGRAGRPTDDLILYLPSVAFWAALAAWAWSGGRGRGATLRLWYLVAGAALFLNQYPRMDHIHLLWSAGPLLVAGADLLHRLYRTAVRGSPALARSLTGRLALGVALLTIPAVACLPNAWWRLASWATLGPPEPTAVHGAPLRPQERLAPLTLPGGGRVWVREAEAGPVVEVVDLLRSKTAPGEPVFTYPAIPGFVYLADRPAATRYLHLFAGMAAAEEQESLVRQLEGVRYVVWDDGGAHYWVRPGDNAPVTEYVRTNFRVERFIGPYAVLSRDATGPYLPYTIPNG